MGTMPRRTVNRLYDLDIDEISTVDRMGNAGAEMVIAKRDEGAMTLYDTDGHEVAEAELTHGQVVYDDEGTEFVFAEAGREEEIEAELAEILDGGLEQFEDDDEEDAPAEERELASVGKRHPSRRSTGASVYEQLAKALTTTDDREVVAKALDAVAEAKRESAVSKREVADLREIVSQLVDIHEDAQYLEVAKSYGVPGAPEDIAQILKVASRTMPADLVAKMDRMFTATGDRFAELGTGATALVSDTMDRVTAVARQHVGKSGITEEQAVTALFDVNTEAYDEYLSEKG